LGRSFTTNEAKSEFVPGIKMSSPTFSRAEVLNREWLGSGKRRRKNKAVTDYFTDESTVNSKRKVLHDRRNNDSNGDKNSTSSDFFQPSLKDFICSRSRKPKSRPAPSKKLSPEEAIIPVSFVSTGVRKKVSPSSAASSSRIVKSSADASHGPEKQSGGEADCLKEKKSVLEQSREHNPPSKKRKLDADMEARVHQRSWTCPNMKNPARRRTGNKEMKTRLFKRDASTAVLRALGQEEDKENQKPLKIGEVLGQIGFSKAYVKKERCSKRDPLVDITLDIYPNKVTGSTTQEGGKPLIRETLPNQTVKHEQVVGNEDTVSEATAGNPPVNPPLSDAGRPTLEDIDVLNFELSGIDSQQSDELMLDTEELLAELSYCEKLSV